MPRQTIEAGQVSAHSWGDRERNYFIGTHYVNGFQPKNIVTQPGEVLDRISEVLSAKYLQPGWQFREGFGDDSYGVLVFTNPSRDEVTTTPPHPAELLQDNPYGKIGTHWYGSVSWPVSELPINDILLRRGTNLGLDSRPTIGYHELSTGTHALPSREFQSGAALVILHLTSIDEIAKKVIRGQSDYLHHVDSAEQPGSGLEQLAVRVSALRAAVVVEPKSLFT